MDRFVSGLIGIGLGFIVFLPSYLFADRAVSGSVDTIYLVPMVLGIAVMYSAPLIFWILMPLLDKLRS